jgi:hypothetical protein
MKRIAFIFLFSLIVVCPFAFAEVNDGTPCTYPSSAITYSDLVGTDLTDHEPVEGAMSCTKAIGDELGTDVAQGKTTLKAYLQTEHDNDGEHTNYFTYCFEANDVASGQSDLEIPLAGADMWITGSTTWDASSIASTGTSMEAKDVTVTGAALGDIAFASLSIDLTDLTLTANVTASDTVTAVLANKTGAAVDLASATLKAKVLTNSFTYASSEIEMPWAGSIVGVSIEADAAITSGSCAADPAINGAAIAMASKATVDVTNTLHHAATQAKDTDSFNAGDRLSVEITSSGTFAPADTTSLYICVNVTFND